MRVLVDLDGVLADFEAYFLERWLLEHPGKFFVPLEERSTFHIFKQYPAELASKVHQIYNAPDFFGKLKPVPGGVEALEEMTKLGLEVFICTSPLREFKNCVLEKYEWVAGYLGRKWSDRIILTRDKTLIKADFLIDDNPEPLGAEIPAWEHIIYDQPYNRTITAKKRLTWANWREVLNC
jgi:5'-nucleotidase